MSSIVKWVADNPHKFVVGVVMFFVFCVILSAIVVSARAASTVTTTSAVTISCKSDGTLDMKPVGQ